MLYLGNAFSLGMFDCIPEGVDETVEIAHVGITQVKQLLDSQPWKSCVGHADTAELLSAMLGVSVPMRRISTSLKSHDVIIVAQYNGPRLPEGATSLPEGARIRWFKVTVGQHCLTCRNSCGELCRHIPTDIQVGCDYHNEHPEVACPECYFG